MTMTLYLSVFICDQLNYFEVYNKSFLLFSSPGLRSQQKFVGCLRAVYFNHDSVLEKLKFHQAVYHGGMIQYGCQDMEHTALQFPSWGSYVKKAVP